MNRRDDFDFDSSQKVLEKHAGHNGGLGPDRDAVMALAAIKRGKAFIVPCIMNPNPMNERGHFAPLDGYIESLYPELTLSKYEAIYIPYVPDNLPPNVTPWIVAIPYYKEEELTD